VSLKEVGGEVGTDDREATTGTEGEAGHIAAGRSHTIFEPVAIGVRAATATASASKSNAQTGV
jgi:hypothetical protein